MISKSFFLSIYILKYFVLSIIISLLTAIAINKYSTKIYDVNAKIQILDKKQNNLETPSTEDLFSNSKINLENEIEVITSYSIFRKGY